MVEEKETLKMHYALVIRYSYLMLGERMDKFRKIFVSLTKFGKKSTIFRF